jgi:rubrerythrin
MSEQMSPLVHAVRLAATAEKEAVEFYKDAAQKVSKKVLQRLFLGLSQLEQLHYDKVTELAESLQKKGKFVLYEGSALTIPEQSEIDLAEDAGETLQSTKLSVMDVITAAQNIEVAADKRYTELAEQTSDSDGKAMFERLAREEKRHLDLLTKLYWTVNQRGALAWASW